MTARSSQIIYWTATGLTVIAFAATGIANLARVPAVVEGVTHLGYPAYLATILGVWQLLGATAIAAPVTPRTKEWAYAGMFFNLTGAAASHVASGDPLGRALVPLMLLGVVMTSWALRSADAAVEDRGNSTVPVPQTGEGSGGSATSAVSSRPEKAALAGGVTQQTNGL